MNIAISTHDVRKRFGNGTGTEALRGVNFEARLGELTFIVGPSGCGKTTLLSVITGLLDPSDGEVELFGSNAGRLPANQRILFRRENIGFVFQQFNLLPALTAAENAAVPLIAAGMKRTEAVDRAKALLDQLGLNGRRDALPATLSGGEQQRVALARALVHEPRLIVCDEPTAALDHATGEAVTELLAGSGQRQLARADQVRALRTARCAQAIAHRREHRACGHARASGRLSDPERGPPALCRPANGRVHRRVRPHNRHDDKMKLNMKNVWILATAAILIGCRVSPDYRAPQSALPAG